MSYANVNDAIQAISSIDATQADIIGFVRHLSVEASGSTTVLYAGDIENTPAWRIVESMGGDVRHIGRTMVAEVLNSDEFTRVRHQTAVFGVFPVLASMKSTS